KESGTGMLFGRRAMQLDPLTGAVRLRAMRVVAEKRNAIGLELPPRGSIFLVMARGAANSRLLSMELERVEKPASAPSETAKRCTTPGPGRVKSDGPDAPPPRELRDLRELVSWTEWPDARAFSGRATYATSFSLGEPPPRRAKLVLAQVRDVAEVRVNGVRAA